MKRSICILCVILTIATMVLPLTASARTLNWFTSKRVDGYFCAYYEFVPAAGGPGEHVKQAYVSANRKDIKGNYSGYTGRKYSAAATSSKINRTYYTPTVRIKDLWNTCEYTYYGLTYFK